MAQVQYGVVITEIKGKVGGTVLQKGNGSKIMRNVGYRKGGSTVARSTAVTKLVAITTLWRGLTDTQRKSWVDGAGLWPFYDRFGVAYTGSGFQVFGAYNTARKAIGEDVVNTLGTAESPDDPGVMSGSFFDSFLMQVGWANDGGSGDYAQVYCSAPQSPGVMTTNVPVRLIKTQAMDGTDVMDIGSEYQAIFPTVYAGQKIIVKAVRRRKGFPYPYFPQSFIAIVDH